MSEKNDRLQQAADALSALRDARQAAEETAPAEQGRQPEPAAPPAEEPSKPAEEPQAAAPQEPLVHVVIKRLGTNKPPKPKKQPKVKEPPPPPPVLTPVQRVQRMQQIEFRRTVIPVLLTTGLAMVLLGVWSAGVLAGGMNLLQPGADPDVSTTWLAKLCLLAWPVAAVLLTAAGFFMHDVYCWYRMCPPPKRPGGVRAG